MSTRAILGVVQKDGSFLGAWQWNDGGSILNLLNRKFVDTKSVKELLSVGMWSCMFGPREFKEHYDYTINYFGENTPPAEKVRMATKLSNNVYLTRENYYDNAPKVYRSVEDAMGEDINYVYVYFPNLQKWKKYRWDALRTLKKDGLA